MLYFLGPPIPGSSKASVKFYAVLPVGIFRVGTQEVNSLFVIFSIDFCLEPAFQIYFCGIVHFCIVLIVKRALLLFTLICQ